MIIFFFFFFISDIPVLFTGYEALFDDNDRMSRFFDNKVSLYSSEFMWFDYKLEVIWTVVRTEPIITSILLLCCSNPLILITLWLQYEHPIPSSPKFSCGYDTPQPPSTSLVHKFVTTRNWAVKQQAFK